MSDALRRIAEYAQAFRDGIARCDPAAPFNRADWIDAYNRLARLRDRYVAEQDHLTPSERNALSRVFEKDVFKKRSRAMTRNGFVVGLSLVVGASALAQAPPVQVSNVHLNAKGDVVYQLQNLASQKATAWAVELQVADANGTLQPQGQVITDEYLVESRRGVQTDAEIDARLLVPDRGREFTIPGQFQAAPRLSVVAVVFEDRTAVGNSSTIDRIFHQRAADRGARERILTELRGAQRSNSGPGVLQEAKRRLTVTPSDDPGGVREMTINNLESLSRQAEAQKLDPDAVLKHHIAMLEREYQAAAKHAVKAQRAGR